jgi:hypothetical protein
MELDAGRNPARRHPPSLNQAPASVENAFAGRLPSFDPSESKERKHRNYFNRS